MNLLHLSNNFYPNAPANTVGTTLCTSKCYQNLFNCNDSSNTGRLTHSEASCPAATPNRPEATLAESLNSGAAFVLVAFLATGPLGQLADMFTGCCVDGCVDCAEVLIAVPEALHRPGDGCKLNLTNGLTNSSGKMRPVFAEADSQMSISACVDLSNVSGHEHLG